MSHLKWSAVLGLFAITTVLANDSYEIYRVKSGDCLSTISERFLNSAHKWKTILDLNKNIKNPNFIRIGQAIRIPKNSLALAQPGDSDFKENPERAAPHEATAASTAATAAPAEPTAPTATDTSSRPTPPTSATVPTVAPAQEAASLEEFSENKLIMVKEGLAKGNLNAAQVEALEQSPRKDPETIIYLAQATAKLGKPEESQKLFEAELEKNPADSQTRREYARLLVSAKTKENYLKAVAEMDKVVEEDPQNMNAALERYTYALKSGDPALAAKIKAQTLKSFPQLEAALR